ncbi:MAG: hypothetical protein L6R39_003230 [Caloplaca ligustica]|nr:MAG: hypothetical protein L6R39_003230 [Caloplaca ligustica]
MPKYIVNKVNKKLESNKLRAGFKDAPNQLLLPISFGCSSISLLHVLDKQLHQQEEKTGRFSFQIHVLYIDQSAAGLQVDSDGTWRALKERFPSHSYSIARIEDVCDDDTDFASDGFLPTSSTANGPNFSKQQRLEDFLAGLPSATSRADMISILRSRLIASFAKKQDCSSILYGDSTTRLAERTLSETAKGRGAAIPWLTADGESPHGVKVVYPIRDLLRKEIVAYTTMTDPPLTPLILEDRVRDVVTSSKNTTIEALMGQYFESVEQNYPSIVANAEYAKSVNFLLQREARDCAGAGSKNGLIGQRTGMMARMQQNAAMVVQDRC